MADLSIESSLKVSDDVVFRELDGEAIILNLASGVYFGLDPVGTRMWQLIEQHGRLSEVVTAMRVEYDAAPEKIERDLVALVSELSEKGLVRRVDPEAPESVKR